MSKQASFFLSRFHDLCLLPSRCSRDISTSSCKSSSVLFHVFLESMKIDRKFLAECCRGGWLAVGAREEGGFSVLNGKTNPKP